MNRQRAIGAFIGPGSSSPLVTLNTSFLQQHKYYSPESISWSLSSTPRGRSLSAQPIRIRKAQSRKKRAHIPLRTLWISQKLCSPCLKIIKYCYFDYRLNKPFACSRDAVWSRALFTWSRLTTCAKDYGLFLVLITHKSTRSEIWKHHFWGNSRSEFYHRGHI